MYYIALIIIGLIFIWRIAAGFRKGMIKEIISLFAMAAACFCVVLIMGIIGSYLDNEIGKVVQMAAGLFVICLAYRLINILLTSLELISKLPVIKGVDKILGAVVGIAEAGLIVGFLVYFFKEWGLSVLEQI